MTQALQPNLRDPFAGIGTTMTPMQASTSEMDGLPFEPIAFATVITLATIYTNLRHNRKMHHFVNNLVCELAITTLAISSVWTLGSGLCTDTYRQAFAKVVANNGIAAGVHVYMIASGSLFLVASIPASVLTGFYQTALCVSSKITRYLSPNSN